MLYNIKPISLQCVFHSVRFKVIKEGRTPVRFLSFLFFVLSMKIYSLEILRTIRFALHLSTEFSKGRLAQLVQSICLTSRGSAVRIRQRPLKIKIIYKVGKHHCYRLFSYYCTQQTVLP